MNVNLVQQIEEVEYEISMRERVYPGLVTRRKMKQADATYRIERMRAVLKTLQWLQANEAAIKQKVAA